MKQFRLPLRRSNDLSVQQIAQETLVYDECMHKAFCLNPVAASVWALCDGTLTPAQIATAAQTSLLQPVSEDAVLVALAQFEADGLLAAAPAESALPLFAVSAGMSRRRLLAGAGAGAVVMVPVVAALMTPRAAHAYSGCVDCAPNAAQPSSSATPAAQPSSQSGSTPLFNDSVR